MLVKVIFWGASGQAKVVREFIGSIGYELVALFDNRSGIPAPFPGVPLFCGEQGFQDWRKRQTATGIACLVTIGGSRGRDRIEIQRFLEAHSLAPITAVHPRAFVASSAKIAKGCQILAHATVCAEAKMGEACIINTAASVDHESELGTGVHVAPGAILAGCVKVGDFSLIGAGAVVLPRITVGRNTIIGAGAVVTRDVPENKVVWGNPARIMRDNH